MRTALEGCKSDRSFLLSDIDSENLVINRNSMVDNNREVIYLSVLISGLLALSFFVAIVSRSTYGVLE